ncbi:MAG: AAA family ATPase [Parcubacteria group bacterium]|nr:AAA family ATPase [Parcubacteria group bacterium]
MSSTVIIITGLPASGKTTIGKKLSEHFRLPMFSKDMIKELIFDGFGSADREFSKKVGCAAYDLMHRFLEEFLKCDLSCILESNFTACNDNEIFKKLEEKYSPKFIQIFCFADGKVLFERFQSRVESGERHPGHQDANNTEEFQRILYKGKSEPLDVESRLIEVNTTHFNTLNFDDVISRVEQLIKG